MDPMPFELETNIYICFGPGCKQTFKSQIRKGDDNVAIFFCSPKCRVMAEAFLEANLKAQKANREEEKKQSNLVLNQEQNKKDDGVFEDKNEKSNRKRGREVISSIPTKNSFEILTELNQEETEEKENEEIISPPPKRPHPSKPKSTQTPVRMQSSKFDVKSHKVVEAVMEAIDRRERRTNLVIMNFPAGDSPQMENGLKHLVITCGGNWRHVNRYQILPNGPPEESGLMNIKLHLSNIATKFAIFSGFKEYRKLPGFEKMFPKNDYTYWQRQEERKLRSELEEIRKAPENVGKMFRIRNLKIWVQLENGTFNEYFY